MLFASEKPTKKIAFDDAWVTIQHISKGTKDQHKARLTQLTAELQADKRTMELIKADKEDELTPALAKSVEDINNLNYFLVTKSIKSWSSEQEINEETVKALDEKVFDEILKEIQKLNELSDLERKN